MARKALADTPSTSAVLRPPVVLAVEDEAMILVFIGEYLRDAGFTVIEASHADEAIVALKSNLHIDALFSDVRMPGEMDGIGLARWARFHLPGIAILLTSAFQGYAKTADDLCDDGGILHKPYTVEEMERRIRHMLAARNVPPLPQEISHQAS